MSEKLNKDHSVDPESIASEVVSTFKQDVIKELLSSNFQDPKTKIGTEVVQLVGELMKTIVTEATLRSCVQVLREDTQNVTLEHVEKCLPQILLDFP